MKHSHYFKKTPYEHIDVYRVLELFDVTNPSIAHAVKKLLVAGNRGHKDLEKDVQEAIDSLVRWQEMRKEDSIVESNDARMHILRSKFKYFESFDDCKVSYNGESD